MTISKDKVKFNTEKSKKLKIDFTRNDVLKTKRQIRATEYYGMQETFDQLYKDSKAGKKYTKIMEIISSKDNILLAYRNLKHNKGGQTPGVDGKTIDYLKDLSSDEIVAMIQSKLMNYNPKPVKRVYIPKANGKMRPLGIPCIEDRLVQQCVKQVLEPICEAKFHPQSYGFRPQRQAHHAISEFMRNANRAGNHYVVDIDIKGFFDNVNHSKLLKQLWSLGIQDKNLLCVIKKCLLAPIEEKDSNGVIVKTYPTKGTPQGGILSPLLANVVLNELDWWISNQWETYETVKDYTYVTTNGAINRSNKFRALKKSNLKEGFLIRYADDFKICCKTKEDAEKWYFATTQWLKERLKLDYAPDKSKITNLKTSSSEFLGFRFKLKRKGTKWVINSHMTNKAKETMIKDIREQIKKIQKNTTIKNVNILNAKILGRHNYYKIATHINIDMTEIHYRLAKSLQSRLGKNGKRIRKTGNKAKKYEYVYNETYNKFYGEYNYKPTIVCNTPIFPIAGIKHQSGKGFSQVVTPYTEIGREQIHSNLECVEPWQLNYIIKHPIENMSVEYNDNRISLFTAQWGACGLTGYPLNVREMECHHIIPKSTGGEDKFSNLILLSKECHKLIHATKKDTIEKYLNLCLHRIDICCNKNTKKFFDKLNILREEVGNQPILIT